MQRRNWAATAIATVAVTALAAPGFATDAPGSGAPGSGSAADIAVQECTVESSKDISYISFLADGEEIERIEDVDAESYDLTGYDGIEDVDSIEIKSGTTVETADIDCASTEVAEEDDADQADDDQTDDDQTEGTPALGNDNANEQSTATITVEGCSVESDKDISYIAFTADGEDVEKIADVDAESYDLTGYDGIEDIDGLRVKAGTTVETFAITCTADEGVAGEEDDQTDGDETDGDETPDDQTPDDQADDDQADDEVTADEPGTATIALDGCTVESSKDISYIAFLSGGDELDRINANSPSYDLTSYAGIDEVDRVRVKSATTVESFDVACGDATADEATAEETPAEETPVAEEPAEETPAEEAPVAEEPAEETPIAEEPADEDDDDLDDQRDEEDADEDEAEERADAEVRQDSDRGRR